MRLGGYDLVRELSSGPDGVAYEARREGAGPALELRHLSRIPAGSERWEHVSSRVGLLRKISSRAMRPVVDADLEGPQPYIVLAAAGCSLADRLRDEGPMDAEDARAMTAALAEALAFSHRLGIVHGGLCPARVFLGPNGDYVLELTGTDTGAALGLGPLDRACVAPEARASEPIAASADIFALGALWFGAEKGAPHSEAQDEVTVVEGEGLASDGVARPKGETESLRRWMCSRDPEARPKAWEVVSELGSSRAKGASSTERTRSSERSAPDALGRYRLGEVIGRGGMGRVYRAEDLGTGRPVALKVLHPDCASDDRMLRRFRREARLLSQVDNPFIARFVELNEDAGFIYLVMELIEGQSVLKRLQERRKLDEAEALAIAADVARALSDVHALGVVHRDVKPENIILKDAPLCEPSAVLCDFGVARRAGDTESVAITHTGAAIGTPSYMSPEQCEGKEVDARADVYAMGATLFGMLAGRPPFQGEGPGAVIAKHIRDPAPDLGSLRPNIRPSVASLVARMLEKNPDARPADGAALLEEIERVRRGEAVAIDAHPHLPEPADGERPVSYAVELDLESSPEELWPLVADTDRVNRAAGLEAIEWERSAGEDRVQTHGQMQALGMQIAWREHPHEWIAPERFGVLREYSEGPFRWLCSTLELRRREGGGTRLRHAIEIAPRGVLGRTAGRVEVGMRTRRALARVYRRIDWFVGVRARRERVAGGLLPDPFEDASRLPGPARERLARVHTHLLERGLDDAVVERLCAHIEHGTPQSVARIRPRAFAREQDLDEQQVIDACLVAAHEGALVLRWDILCPSCRISSGVVDALSELERHGDCEACNLRFELDLTRSVEMVFGPHPQIRTSEPGTYCIGGPGHFPHVVAQLRLDPGERFDADLRLEEGHYQVTGPNLPAVWRFRVTASAPSARWDLELRPGLIATGQRALSPGRQRIVLTNDLGAEVTVRIERTIAREDALTAADAACLPLFRELFAEEVLAPGQLISVSRVVLLLAQPEDVEALYERQNEMDAYAVLARLYRELSELAEAEGGAVVKIHGDGILASFPEPAAAASAALALARQRRDVGVAVHAGAALATTINGRLDYFGKTVRRVGAMLKGAGGAGVVLGEEITSDPAVRSLLGDRLDGARIVGSANFLAQHVPIESEAPEPAGDTVVVT